MKKKLIGGAAATLMAAGLLTGVGGVTANALTYGGCHFTVYVEFGPGTSLRMQETCVPYWFAANYEYAWNDNLPLRTYTERGAWVKVKNGFSTITIPGTFWFNSGYLVGV